MATHSNTLAWKIPWTEGPGGLQSMGSLGVGHDWATSLYFFTFMHWRRKWQLTSVLLPGESQGRRSLVPAVNGVTQSRTRLKRLSSSSRSSNSKKCKSIQRLGANSEEAPLEAHAALPTCASGWEEGALHTWQPETTTYPHAQARLCSAQTVQPGALISVPKNIASEQCTEHLPMLGIQPGTGNKKRNKTESTLGAWEEGHVNRLPQ